MRKLFNEEQQQYIRDNYMDTPYAVIGEHLACTAKQIQGWVYHNCTSKLRQFDKQYFHNIDSPDKAYWLGFIYADGWIIFNETRRNYELGIQLQRGDAAHLEKFNQALGGAHKIAYGSETKWIGDYYKESYTEYALLRIYAKQITLDLQAHGVVQNKTNNMMFPTIEPYFMDFIRGYFDGDGCLYVAPKLSKSQITFTSSNKAFLEYLQKRLCVEYNINTHIYTEHERKHRLQCSGADMRELLRMMYYDSHSVYLDRKYAKYLTYLQRPTSSETTGVKRAKSVKA